MKRIVTALMWLLLLSVLLFPAGTLIAAYGGYTFKLVLVMPFTVAIAVLSVCAVVLHIRFQSAFDSKLTHVLCAIVAPFSLINAAFFLFGRHPVWAIVSVLITTGCCCFLAIHHAKPAALKIIALSLSALLAYPVGLLGFISVIFGKFGQETVTQTSVSPDGVYYAEVVYSDQGALGGHTVVHVYENCTIDAIVFKIEKTPEQVYSGKWYEYETMHIYWKTDSCLVVDSEGITHEYDMTIW